tara:strand:- start:1305 stop:1565 length:261 start_codon:yes stop_codon:yes gene_type:complete
MSNLTDMRVESKMECLVEVGLMVYGQFCEEVDRLGIGGSADFQILAGNYRKDLAVHLQEVSRFGLSTTAYYDQFEEINRRFEELRN